MVLLVIIVNFQTLKIQNIIGIIHQKLLLAEKLTNVVVLIHINKDEQCVDNKLCNDHGVCYIV